jgi:hypothetical protein
VGSFHEVDEQTSSKVTDSLLVQLLVKFVPVVVTVLVPTVRSYSRVSQFQPVSIGS